MWGPMWSLSNKMKEISSSQGLNSCSFCVSSLFLKTWNVTLSKYDFQGAGQTGELMSWCTIKTNCGVDSVHNRATYCPYIGMEGVGLGHAITGFYLQWWRNRFLMLGSYPRMRHIKFWGIQKQIHSVALSGRPVCQHHYVYLKYFGAPLLVAIS